MKTILTILFAFLGLTAVAQNNFVKGYYVTAEGDTVESYIDDKNWIKSPNYIRVRATPDAAITTLSAAELKGFTVNTGDVFVSEVVEIDKTPVNVNLLVLDAAPTISTDTVLLRVLVKGKLNLLYIEDENAKEHFYVQQQNSQPEELMLLRKLILVDLKEYVSKLEVYKETLARVLHDCPDAANQAYTTELKASTLTKLITKYNNCFKTATDQEYVAKKGKLKYKFGATAGIMPTTLHINDNDKVYDLKSGDGGSLAYTVGLSLNIILPRAQGRWSVYNEIAWKTYEVQTEKEFTSSPNESRKEKIHMDLGYIGLNSMLRYQFPFKVLQPYINVGLANNYSLKSKNQATSYIRSFSVEYTTEEKFMDPIRKYEAAILLGAGARYKKVGAEIRYENGNGMSPFLMVSSKRKALNLLVNYTFN